MKILVYGAGPLGTLFAARLRQGGQDVALLARGRRLADLREHGLVLKDSATGQRTVTRLPISECLASDDAYDLIAVIMRKNCALEILPVLAANQPTPNILFLMNNAAGPEALVADVGKERVLMGFPPSAGMFVERVVVRYLGGTEKRQRAIPIGEVDGSVTDRTRQIATVLSSMPGYRVDIRTDMDAWLKTHVALLFPSIAPAIYAAGLDRLRLTRTRDLLVLMVRAIREGFQVLKTLQVPIKPTALKVFDALPEPLLVAYARALLTRKEMEVALVGHAGSGRDEVRHLAGEFMALARRTPVATPAIDQLLPYLDPATPLMPDGNAKIALRWWK